MIVKTDNMLVCFVNTNQTPRKIKRLGVFQYQIRDKKFYLQELCEVWYPHPEAPTEASVQLLDWIQVEYIPGTQNLISSAIDAVKDIKSLTELIGISEETKVVF
jgi:hypothetical protein